MKVLIATYLAPHSPSGVVTACQSLTRDLTDRGVEVRTVDATTTPTLWRKGLGLLKRLTRPVGGAVSALYEEFGYYSGVYLAARARRDEAFDLIHAHDLRSAAAAYRALGGRVPVVLTCHFNDDPVSELAERFALKPAAVRSLTAWYRRLFSEVKNYVFVSEYALSKSKHLLPVDARTLILPNTVRLPETMGDEKRPADDKLILSNVGHFDERKNQRLLIEIGHELRQQGWEVEIWLIGDGPERTACERLASERGLNGSVKFWGRQQAPWQRVAQSDLYVHTALNDNCPYALLEAFAVNTPVLALPVGGIPELLPDGAGALRGGTPAELAGELVPFFDPENRRRLADKQAAHAAGAFDPDRAVARLLHFYQQAMPRTDITWLTSAPERLVLAG